VPFRQPPLPHRGVETAAVVRDDEPGNAVVDCQFDAKRAGIRIRDHVPHGLLRDPVDERLPVSYTHLKLPTKRIV